MTMTDLSFFLCFNEFLRDVNEWKASDGDEFYLRNVTFSHLCTRIYMFHFFIRLSIHLNNIVIPILKKKTQGKHGRIAKFIYKASDTSCACRLDEIKRNIPLSFCKQLREDFSLPVKQD